MAKGSGGGKALIVASKVRALVKSKKCMTSSEFLPALSKAVADLVDHAAARAKANRRSTLKAKDL